MSPTALLQAAQVRWVRVTLLGVSALVGFVRSNPPRIPLFQRGIRILEGLPPLRGKVWMGGKAASKKSLFEELIADS